MKNKISIIAGPCSIDYDNIHEIFEISKIKFNGKNAIAGTRVVGLKSRTSYNHKGAGMGIDFKTIQHNFNLYLQGKSINKYKKPPSFSYIERIIKETHLLVSSEIMFPFIQLPLYSQLNLENRFMPWNPSVNQLGWQILELSKYAKNNSWYVGIKNGKWIGDKVSKANSKERSLSTPIEKVWNGLSTYAHDISKEKIILIHRGFDVPEKKDFRNLPLHNLAKKIKQDTRAQLYFDPSHAYGPKLKNNIVTETIKAMKIKIDKYSYLYDGILIETGTSKTDTGQHISINELKDMIKELGSFRDFQQL